MSNLEIVLKDFFDCFYIPIRYVDSNFKLTYKIASSSNIDEFIEDVKLYEYIKKNATSIKKLTYYDNIHFIIAPIKNSLYNGYVIAGPFRSSNITIDINIPFKPFYCINNIQNMLKSIIKENLNNRPKLSSHVSSSIAYIHKNYKDDIKIDDICSYLNINKSYFCRLFKKEIGYTFSDFLNKFRVEKSKDFLSNDEYSILDVAMSVGYNSHSYYSSLFKKFNNITPVDYRNGYNTKTEYLQS
ncbi:helix-turn-helix domain-containing protein [Terrisporobacter sp.]|uniref:helix-turn-helix domain-containing protein n=1 Tax=Terrisporobacter sp. TaxID=1965305 RepID=UPI00261BCCE1|nr:AraC family transcriptional regulator [Terrisporobacter sp.]